MDYTDILGKKNILIGDGRHFLWIKTQCKSLLPNKSILSREKANWAMQEQILNAFLGTVILYILYPQVWYAKEVNRKIVEHPETIL